MRAAYTVQMSFDGITWYTDTGINSWAVAMNFRRAMETRYPDQKWRVINRSGEVVK